MCVDVSMKKVGRKCLLGIQTAVSITHDKLVVDIYLLMWSPGATEPLHLFNSQNNIGKLLSHMVEVQELNMVTLRCHNSMIEQCVVYQDAFCCIEQPPFL